MWRAQTWTGCSVARSKHGWPKMLEVHNSHAVYSSYDFDVFYGSILEHPEDASSVSCLKRVIRVDMPIENIIDVVGSWISACRAIQGCPLLTSDCVMVIWWVKIIGLRVAFDERVCDSQNLPARINGRKQRFHKSGQVSLSDHQMLVDMAQMKIKSIAIFFRRTLSSINIRKEVCFPRKSSNWNSINNPWVLQYHVVCVIVGEIHFGNLQITCNTSY